MRSSSSTGEIWTRRDFLGVAGGLIVLFSAPSSLRGQTPATPDWKESIPADRVESWLALLEDGRVLAAVGKIEAGMGVSTAFVQIVADELDVDLERVVLVMGDTASTVDQRGTGSSNGIVEGGSALRKAAVAVRHHLLGLAAVHLGADVEKLTVNSGVVTVSGGAGPGVTYAELVKGRKVEFTLAKQGVAKSPDRYRYIGKRVPRIDIPPKVEGTYEYLVDVNVPSMVHARILRPPQAGAQLIGVPAGFASPGLIQVVTQANFVAVICEQEYQAVRAARNLIPQWSTPDPLFSGSYDELYSRIATGQPAASETADTVGSVDDGLQAAAQVLQARYEFPFQSHACMGPGCGVADVGEDSATVWMGGQKPYSLRRAVAKLLGLKPGRVRVVWVAGPGSYGMNDADDAAMDAAFLSSRVRRPVRVQYSRAEGTAWDPKGPPLVVTMRGGLSAAGEVTAFDYEARGYSGRLRASSTEEPGDSLLGQMLGGWKAKSTNRFQFSTETYRFPAKRLTSHLLPWSQALPTGLRTAHLRDPDGMATCFASECFVDELAAAAHVDPVEFRLRYLGDQRDRDIVSAAAKRAGWEPRASPNPSPGQTSIRRGRGIAYAPRNGTTVGLVTEVAVDITTGRVQVERFVVAHDCGFVVNPGSLQGTIEANLIQGMSRALHEAVRFNSTRVTSTDWLTYPILDMTEVPRAIEIEVINNLPERPSTGAGEPATRPIAASIGNAVFDAIGVRLRRIPFTPETILAEIKKSNSA